MTIAAEDVGLSTAGLADARACAATGVAQGEIAGAVMLVSRHDQVVQLACVGLRDVEAGTPMEPDTIFRIASMTKPVVSVGALMLIESGNLRFDDPISRYVPEFSDLEVFAGAERNQVKLATLERPITVYHLMTHTSGLAYDAPHPALAAAYDSLGDLRYPLPEMMRRIAGRPLAHQPGRAWTYGWSHDVLGRVIEVAADQPLDDYLGSKIFTPLGMVDSGFCVPQEKFERLAVVHESVDGRWQRLDNWDTNRFAERFPLLSGGDGCVSTVPDYLRFIRMLLRRGELDGTRLLKSETVVLMTRNHLSAPLYPLRFGDFVSEGEGYGLGVGVRVERSARGSAESEGTFRWAGGWNTGFWIDPVKELAGIFMAQHEPFAFESVRDVYWSLVCEALID